MRCHSIGLNSKFSNPKILLFGGGVETPIMSKSTWDYPHNIVPLVVPKLSSGGGEYTFGKLSKYNVMRVTGVGWIVI